MDSVARHELALRIPGIDTPYVSTKRSQVSVPVNLQHYESPIQPLWQ